MDSEIEDIKRRIDIVEFIGSYVTLKKAGTNYKGLCPFHNEKTPSMMVSPEKQIFKCFGCNEGGDVFSFLMKTEGLSFGDAIKILADKAGIKLKPRHFDKLSIGEKPGQKSRLLDLQDLAAKLYHKILLEHPVGKEPLKYLEARGITKETVATFNLGYAPVSWDLLIRFAESRGYSEKELLVSGLTVRKTKEPSSGSRISYDRFRERIIFPINNVLGQTVGFTGRLIKDKAESPKYLNSSDSPIYQKSQIIYGLDKAKLAIKQADLVVIVEGNMDVVACHQAGFKNVVAVSGTALTKDMLQILSRYTFNIAFSFDSDNAGRLALKRAIGLAGELDLNTKVIKLPDEFKDPDEAIKADPKNWEQAIAASLPALEYLINFAADAAKDIGQKKQVIKEILPVIKLLKSNAEQDHFLKMLAMKLVISEQSVIDDFKKAKFEKNDTQLAVVANEQVIDELKILALVMEKNNILGEKFQSVVKILALNPRLPAALREKLPKISPEKLQEILKASKLNNKLKEIYLSITKDLDEEVAIEEIADDLVKKLEKQQYEVRKNDLIEQIAKNDGESNKKKRLELLKELNSVILSKKE